MSCPEEGVNFSGILLPLSMRAGTTWKFLTTFSNLGLGVTVTGASVKVYDQDGVEMVGITETATVSSPSVTWGLLSAAETATLTGTGYTYRFNVVTSDGSTTAVYYGPLDVLPASGGGVA